jgi:pimeloyl-ACP methyl ester carboxylesterase
MTDKTNALPVKRQVFDWSNGYAVWLPERIAPVRRVGYTLRDLARRGLMDEETVNAFFAETGLADFAWRMLWANEGCKLEAESVEDMVRRATGVLVFLHGWDGSGEIWEDLPALAVKADPCLIALVPDINGFGGTPFQEAVPPLDRCDPRAAMQAVERWIDLLGLRSAPKAKQRRPFVFVGHSMGGAALFFMDDSKWERAELGRIAVAPALLLNDRSRRRFYRTLGSGIMLTRSNDWIDRLAENVLAPRIINALAGHGSERVHAEHRRIYRSTPEGVVAQTFAAMGRLEAHFEQTEWPFFHVFLGHRDRLVGLQQTLDLLEEINFQPDQIRVALGDHYFFSIGRKAKRHAQNRAMLLEDILALMNELRAEQGKGNHRKK